MAPSQRVRGRVLHTVDFVSKTCPVFLANLQGEVVAVKKFKPWAGQDEESLKKEIELLRHASIRNAVPAVYLGRSIITYVLSLSLSVCTNFPLCAVSVPLPSAART
jgi:hypothetical protein